MVTKLHSKTAQKLLAAAKTLFWKYGFRRVTIEDICTEAGVSKMTFYRYFKNKMVIAKSVFDVEIGDALKDFEEVTNSTEPFVDKLENIIHLKLKHADQIGLEFLQELMQYGGPEFQQYLQEKRLESVHLTNAFFEKAQADGDIRKDLNLALIPILSENLAQLASNKALLQLYGSPADLIKELTTYFFYGIFPNPKHP